MTVQELIDALLKIEDKSKEVHLDMPHDNTKPEVTEVYQAFGAVVIGTATYRD